MKARSDALKLLGEFKKLHDEMGFSVETMIRAIAIQSVIFEKINPVLWEDALTDARAGAASALPETNN